MAVNAANVFVGAPDQAGTTAAILTGPTTDTIPAFIDDFEFTGLQDSGYVSEDGLALTPSDSTESIKDWSGAEIRRILTEFTGEIAWTHLELNPQSAANYFGDDQVEVQAATATTGTQMRMALGKNVLPEKSWYFKVKDGARRVLVFVPRGAISSRDEIDFTSSAAITLPVTLAAFPDAAGQSIYLYTDDGVYSA